MARMAWLVVALMLSGCAGGTDAPTTMAPTTMAPTTDASTSPTAPSSPTTTTTTTSTTSRAPSPTIVQVDIVADAGPSSFTMQPSSLEAGKEYVFRITNKRTVSHTWDILGGYSSGSVGGGATVTSPPMSFEEGTYPTRCAFHPSMTGVFTVT